MLAYGAVSFMLSIDAPVSLLVVREMLMTVLLNALIAMPFFAVVRRVLRPVLLVEPGPRAPARLDDLLRPDRPAGARGLMYLDSDSAARRSRRSSRSAWRSSAASR